MRLFVALPIPDDIADQIVRIQSGITGARWSPRENLHVTLRFVGNANVLEARALDDLLGAIRATPFEISLSGVDHFDSLSPYALWLRVVSNPALHKLQKACERACQQVGFPADARTYSPHVTICYLPRQQHVAPIVAFEQSHNLFKTPPWMADRFYLYNSHTRGSGPSSYSIEAEYPLVI